MGWCRWGDPQRHAAVAAAMRFRGGLWGVLGRVIPLPVINILGSAAYRVIARNRHRCPEAPQRVRLIKRARPTTTAATVDDDSRAFAVEYC